MAAGCWLRLCGGGFHLLSYFLFLLLRLIIFIFGIYSAYIFVQDGETITSYYPIAFTYSIFS